MNKYDNLYLITLSFNQEFMSNKVSVVKVLRGLFGMTLREAKQTADDHICAESNQLHNANYRDVKLLCNPSQFALAMALFMRDEQPQVKLKNEFDDSYTANMFMWKDVEIIPTHYSYDISKFQ